MWNPFGRFKRASREAPQDLTAQLLEAATEGDAEVVGALLKSGAYPNCRDERDMTPLMAAATRGHDSVIRLLLDAGADVLARDNRGSTALHFASAQAGPSTTRMLLQAGANPRGTDKAGGVPAFDAVLFQNEGMLRFWASELKLDELREQHGASVVHWAALHDRAEALGCLLEVGVSAELKDGSGRTPLLLALFARARSAATLLLERGAVVTAVSDDGWSALHDSAYGGLVGHTRILLERGLSPNALSDRGETPLHVAAGRGYGRVLATLIELGGDSSLRDADGKSVEDVKRESVAAWHVVETVSLLRQLPDRIAAWDMQALVDVLEGNPGESISGMGGGRVEPRAFLADLVHAYRVAPDRVGEVPVATEGLVEVAEGVHPGELD